MNKILINPAICNGKPYIKNTRIMVKNIIGMLAGGYSVKQILSEYPELTQEDISEALQYTAKVINEEKVILKEAM